MRGGVLLLVIALLLLYLGVTGRYKCLTKAFGCILGEGDGCACGGDKTLSGGVNSTDGQLTGFPSVVALTPLRGFNL